MLVEQFADPEVRVAAGPADTLERRASTRLRTVFWIAKVTREHDVGLWRVENISSRGVMLQIHIEVAVGERVSIALSDTHSVRGAVKWHEGQRCGVEFDAPIRCERVLRMLAAERRSAGYRAPRLVVDRGATAWCEHGLKSVRVRNVSQHGLGLAHDGQLQPGTRLKLQLENGLERRGVVRWSSEGQSGLRLLEPLGCSSLESCARF